MEKTLPDADIYGSASINRYEYLPLTERFYDAEDTDEETTDVGLIPVDAIFSPVTRVRYSVEDTRVGQKTNYDKLSLELCLFCS